MAGADCGRGCSAVTGVEGGGACGIATGANPASGGAACAGAVLNICVKLPGSAGRCCGSGAGACGGAAGCVFRSGLFSVCSSWVNPPGLGSAEDGEMGAGLLIETGLKTLVKSAGGFGGGAGAGGANGASGCVSSLTGCGSVDLSD